MNSIGGISKNLSLDHILELNRIRSRIRKGPHALKRSVWEKIVLFFKDIFCGGCKKTDIKEFRLYNPLLSRKITDLQKQQEKPDDEFFKSLKTLLHAQAKIQFTGWSKSLRNVPEYQEFTNALLELQKQAQKTVKIWHSKSKLPQQQKDTLKRWAEADENQLKFAGYCNEIVYRADEVPIGSVLLVNPYGLRMRNKILRIKPNWEQKMQVLKGAFFRIAMPLPLIHSMVALGDGKFFHISKYNETKGKSLGIRGGGVLEDFSEASRGGKPKYLYGYEIMVPNKEAFEKVVREDLNKFLQEKWLPTIKRGIGATVLPRCTALDSVCCTKRPAVYDLKKTYNPRRKKGYSCSGIISASYAVHGIDIAPQKKVDRTAPADFALSPIFDVAFSNSRQKLEQLRAKQLKRKM